MGIDLPSDFSQNAVLYFDDEVVEKHQLDNGIYRLCTGRVRSGGTVELYAIGQDPGLVSDDIKVYYDYKCEKVIAEGGTVNRREYTRSMI